MKTKLSTVVLFILFSVFALRAGAEEQTRKVDPFSEISLRIEAKVHLEQGNKQNLEIVAKESTLEEIITEVKDGKLIIRFPNKDYFWNTFRPGEITIYITTPEITGLGVSGSGDIMADDEINTRSLDMAVSGSGNIRLSELTAKKVSAIISGSGNIELRGKELAQDLSVSISGSGNYRGTDFEAGDVNVRISGSGNAAVGVKDNLNIRLAGSGNVSYKGNPAIDQSIAGSGKVRKL